MKENLEKYIVENLDEDAEIVYSLNQIKKDFTIVELHNGYIAYKIEDLWLNFHVFNFYSSYDDEVELNLFWCGYGTLGDLKELRHSYFEEYVFYANLKLIERASQWLQQYFD